MAEKSDRLVMVGVAQDELEANVWRDILAQEGIPVFVKAADPLASFGVTPGPGSLHVFVQARDEMRARWLLGKGESVE
jgi:acyl-homoserine lactone acylase PvdQ